MNKLGIHCQKMTDRLIGIIRDWQPRVVVWVDPSPVGIAAIRAASPGVFIVGRKYEEGTWHTTDLKGRAYQWADACAAMGHCDAYYPWNEPFGHDSVHEFAPFDEFQMWYRERMLQHGMEAVGLNVGTGNFTKDGPSISASFPDTCRTFALLGIHEYSWPSMRHGVGYHCSRWPYWLEDIGRDDVRLIVTECGMTQAVIAGRPDEGWRSKADGVEDWHYLDSLSWYNSELVKDARVMGAAIFNFEGHGWATFEHADVPHIWQAIAGMDAPVPPEPPPNGGDNVIKVFDLEGNELFGEEALDRIAFHGITVHEPENLRPGEWYWAVVRMRESMGPACFVYTGLLEDGSAAVGQEAAWAWTDNMGDADDILGDNYPTDWQLQADLGVLNENGNMGPAYGQHGWFKNPYEPGPGRAWIRDPLRWAVKLTGMGMQNMTNHHTMFATWQLKQWEGGEPPIPPVPPADLLAIALRVEAAVLRMEKDLFAIRKTYVGDEEPPPPPPPPEPEVFHGAYFNNITLSGPPALERDDVAINFNWGGGSPGPGVNADNFSVSWAGLFTFEAAAYRFKVRADDGVRLYVDGVKIIDAWKDQGPTDYEATVTLSAGLHPVGLEYYERGGGAVIGLVWEKVG